MFFDDLSDRSFDFSFALTQSVGDSLLPAYVPIAERRRELAYGTRERDFQAYRRGRYVEFNLVYDRGTLFGLQSAGAHRIHPDVTAAGGEVALRLAPGAGHTGSTAVQRVSDPSRLAVSLPRWR